VRILLDGIPESEPDGQTRIEAIDFNSIGYIEVVKGNLSSLYPNAPGGVINFINGIDFQRSFVSNFNQFGSYNLRRNGFKVGVKTNHYNFLATYSYHNYKGYREHSEDYWHILNTVLESKPGDNSTLQLLGYFVDGIIRLPGSLTWEQFEENPFQAQQRDLDRDSKRITSKGRLGIRFNTFFDDNRRNELELIGYGTIKYFERASGVYRVINRYVLGATARFLNRSQILGRQNEFSVGGDLQYQTGPVEFYENIAGKKGDNLNQLIDNTQSVVGLYFLNSLNLKENKLDLFVSGRYDKTIFNLKDQLLGARSAKADYEGFTPKIALNYKLNPFTALFASVGSSFTSPAGNELNNYPDPDNPGPDDSKLVNPRIKSQESLNFEIGTKSSFLNRGTVWFNNSKFEAAFFKYKIDREIVPFDLFGEVFFRNAAKTDRTGIEFGTTVGIIGELKFEGSYTFSDFVYDEYIARSFEVDSLGEIRTIDRDFAGNLAPSIPKHNLILSFIYEHRFNFDLTGFSRIGYRGVSGMYVDDRNSNKTDNFQVFNFTMGLDWSYKNFSCLLSGGVNNIFDATHVEFININSARQEFYEPGEPRTYFATLNLAYRF
jgi:iron complex outermembrane receptor protein